MSYDPENPGLAEMDLPTPQQLREFDDRVRYLVANARYPYKHEDSVGVRFYNRHGDTTIVGIGREVILFELNAVDMHIRRVIKEDDDQGHSVEQYEDYAYSPDSGKTYYDERLAGFINGQRLRSEDEQRGIDLTTKDPDLAVYFALNPKALQLAEGPLADYVREVVTRGAVKSEHNVLTKARMEIALEELRSLSPSDEELPNNVVRAIIQGLMSDEEDLED